MTFFKPGKKTLCIVLLITFLLSLAAPWPGPRVAEASAVITLGDLEIGDRVVDPFWQWEFKTGNGYTGTGPTKPVTWIVAAKDHYTVEGGVSHVTLLAGELIARYPFDDSTDRDGTNGFNHWGDSGKPNAEHGLRPFLNSLDKPAFSYAGEGFYDAFSPEFKDAVLATTVPNKDRTGDPYVTEDRVFIPSLTELGLADENIHDSGEIFPYILQASNPDAARRANLAGTFMSYWTRSPGPLSRDLATITSAGTHQRRPVPNEASCGVRPVVNLPADVQVLAAPDGGGAHRIVWTSMVPIGRLNIGDKVVDPSWQWEFKTGFSYTGAGERKPVTWIVVAKDHYDVEGGGSSVTLLAEELIGRHPYDDSTNRGEPGETGSNHWGDSGAPNAEHGLRPFLNSLDKSEFSYTGAGFYAAFSQEFKDAVLTTTVPNKVAVSGDAYDTLDRVFIPSSTEMGGSPPTAHEIGTAYPFYTGAGDPERIAHLAGEARMYWTRSTSKWNANNVGNINETGFCGINTSSWTHVGIRPVLNLSPDVMVSTILSEDLAYEITWTQPIGYLDIGDRVVDNSWEWEFKTGDGYSGSGIKKPLTWIVVAKDHYDVEGGRAHVTLLSEELIARRDFDATSCHWGNSSLRSFLNNIFYGAASDSFREAIVNTGLPNAEGGQGQAYETEDHIFIPSQTELGGGSEDSYSIGTVLAYFTGPAGLAALFPEDSQSNYQPYWTRSPDTRADNLVRFIDEYAEIWGHPSFGERYIRPALNLDARTLVSIGLNENDAHVIFSPTGLTATIDPPEARAEGARWSIDGGEAWQESGAELSLEPGPYTVIFEEIAGWITPQPAEVQVTTGVQEVSARYIPRYGDINRNGDIDVGDAILILRDIMTLTDLETLYGPTARLRANVSGGEGPLNAGDADLILRRIVGLLAEFPVESL